VLMTSDEPPVASMSVPPPPEQLAEQNLLFQL
jgi:hypothetical protein